MDRTDLEFFDINRMLKIFITTIIVFQLVSCRTSQKPIAHVDGLQTINIEEFEQGNPVEMCMDRIKVIPLATHSDHLIGAIKRIEVCKPYLFILDNNNNFFIYNIDGSFISKITATGKGPEEVSHVTNFYVNTNKQYVGIYDYLKEKIFRYSFKGNLLEILSCKSKLFTEASEINQISNNKLLLSLDYTPGLKHSFAIVNCNDYSLAQYCKPYSYTWKNLSSDGDRPKQTQNQTGTYIISMLSDTLYYYSENDFTPICVLKSNLEPASQNTINPKLVSDYSDVLIQAYKNSNMSRGFLKILMTDSVAYSLYYYNKKANNLFWNLNTGKGYISESLGGYPNAFADFMAITTSGNDFIGYVPAHKLNLKAIKKQCAPEVVKILSNVKEDDNPIIVFYPITVN